MRKISILTVLIAVLVFGVFSITNNSNAQDNNNAERDIQVHAPNQTEEEVKMNYSYFHSGESFYDKNDLIARDTKFTTQGVTINATLIKVNQDTREFITTFGSGKMSRNKVEISIPEDIADKVNYSAQMVDRSDRTIHLRGNAKVQAGNMQFIEAQEIIITTDIPCALIETTDLQ